MAVVNATNFRKNVFGFIGNAIKYNEVLNISTKDGNAVLMSEEEYNGIMETLYLCSVPELKEKIVDRMNKPLDKSVSEDEVKW